MPSDAVSSGSLRVLLVEDDPEDVRLLVKRLRSAADGSWEVRDVGTLAEAVTLLDAGEVAIDVVLLDLGLPDATGLGGLEHLRQDHPEVPVVVLAGLEDNRLAAAAVEAGAQEHLVKGSVTGKALHRTLRHAVERHRLQQSLASSEQRFRTMAESAQDVIYRLRLHPRAEFEYLNPAVETISGFSRQDFLDNPRLYVERVHPEDVHQLREGDLLAGVNHTVTVRFRHAAGHWIFVEDAGSPVVEGDRIVGVQGVIRDVTSRERTERALRDTLEAEQRTTAELRAGAQTDAAPVSPPATTAATEAESTVTWATRQLLDVETVDAAAAILLRTVHRLGGWTIPARLDDGRVIPVDIALGTGEPLLPAAEPGTDARVLLERHLPPLVADARAIADRLIRTEHLTAAATADALSGLANRRSFDRAVARVTDRDVVVIIDLDSFKQVNDTAGHQTGDEVIRTFGACLRAQVREGDMAARVGGDEFVLLLRDTDPDGAEQMLERIRVDWSNRRPHPVTFSAGVARSGGDGGDALRAADAALYDAKDARGTTGRTHEPQVPR